MAQILSNDKVPYFLTILFGIFAWCISHIVDRVVETPLIKYSVNSNFDRDILTSSYEITNITKTKVFENIDFLIYAENSDSIITADKILSAPMKQISETDIFEIKAKYVAYHVSSLQPSCHFIIRIEKKGALECPLRYFSKAPIVLSKSSMQTCLLENESYILIIFGSICAFLIIAYIIFSK